MQDCPDGSFVFIAPGLQLFGRHNNLLLSATSLDLQEHWLLPSPNGSQSELLFQYTSFVPAFNRPLPRLLFGFWDSPSNPHTFIFEHVFPLNFRSFLHTQPHL